MDWANIFEGGIRPKQVLRSFKKFNVFHLLLCSIHSSFIYKQSCSLHFVLQVLLDLPSKLDLYLHNHREPEPWSLLSFSTFLHGSKTGSRPSPKPPPHNCITLEEPPHQQRSSRKRPLEHGNDSRRRTQSGLSNISLKGSGFFREVWARPGSRAWCSIQFPRRSPLFVIVSDRVVLATITMFRGVLRYVAGLGSSGSRVLAARAIQGY